MATVAKQRGLTQRIAAWLEGLRQRMAKWLVEWIYPEIIAKDQATQQAVEWSEDEVWKKKVPCIKCKKKIPALAAVCPDCNAWQEDMKKASKEATQPVPSIRIGDETLFFYQGRTGNLTLEGERPRDAYIKKWRELFGKDRFLLK